MDCKILVSVVIPVYNVEDYLDACLRSVVTQTYSNLDIVLIDDGSSDSSPQICDMWKKKDDRISVVHQQNKGVTIARKIGVESSRGKWICFVDSDDTLPLSAIECLVKASDDCDIVIGQILFNGPYKWPYSPRSGLVSSRKYISLLMANNKIHCGPVAKIFKKELFWEKTFSIPRNIVCGEDFLMNLRLAQHATNVRFIKDVVYSYDYREKSAAANSPFVSLSYSVAFAKYVAASFERRWLFSLTHLLLIYFVMLFFSCFKRKVRNFISGLEKS